MTEVVADAPCAPPAPFAVEGWTTRRFERPVFAAFSGRSTGVSAGPYASLNVGDHVGDDAAAVTENRTRLATALGLQPDWVVSPRQVHGTAVLDVDELRAREGKGWTTLDLDADALVTRAGRPVAVVVADCAPVVVASATALAVVHAGWRGLVDGVLEAAVVEVADGGPLEAVVGPCIGACCFEVGGDVAARFDPADVTAGTAPSEQARVDLVGAAVRRLGAAGVATVDRLEVCTRCDEGYFSVRGDGATTGRQAVVAWRRP